MPEAFKLSASRQRLSPFVEAEPPKVRKAPKLKQPELPARGRGLRGLQVRTRNE